MIRKWMKVGEPVVRITRLAARLRLCNGLPPADRDMILSRLVPEPGLAMGTPVDYELADDLDLTYVHTTRDRMVRPSEQRHYVSVLPERTRRLTLDCGHSAHHSPPGHRALSWWHRGNAYPFTTYTTRAEKCGSGDECGGVFR